MPSADWNSVWSFTVSPIELIVRGTAVYWFLFLVFRFLVRRDVGSIAIADVLLLVIVADAIQNAMAGGYDSVTDGLVLVSTIVAWNMIIDWASFRFTPVRRVLQPPPLALVRNGRVLARNLAKERISRDELDAKLREQGIDRLDQVRSAWMESDGAVSVIRQ